MLGSIKLMANLSFQLWEMRNQCRHGHDNATRQQSMHDQAHREIRCLYQLKNLTLPQDLNLFRHLVDEHLTETVPQLRTWIVHSKNLFSTVSALQRLKLSCILIGSNGSSHSKVYVSQPRLRIILPRLHGTIGLLVSLHTLPYYLEPALGSRLSRRLWKTMHSQ
jgi:hypothetical protein